MSEAQTHTLGQNVQVPIRLRDEGSIGHVSAVFRLLASPSIGPSALAPDAPMLLLEGDGEEQTEATIEASCEDTEELVPGDYLYVAIHVRDMHDHRNTTESPSPAKVIRLGSSAREGPGKPAEFLGWE
ncbi:MAG: hypothetical protein M3M97_04605 [Actinomycetota bacterium]|nr:hypothetical protein [Actinomycetota bacterium]